MYAFCSDAYHWLLNIILDVAIHFNDDTSQKKKIIQKCKAKKKKEKRHENLSHNHTHNNTYICILHLCFEVSRWLMVMMLDALKIFINTSFLKKKENFENTKEKTIKKNMITKIT